MIHYMRLHKEPFDSIKSGNKTYELRLYDEKRQAIQSGDLICFTSPNDEQLLVRVKQLHIFASFHELYATLPLLQCGYDDESEAKAEDMEAYYSKSEQQKYGAIGIEIEVCQL